MTLQGRHLKRILLQEVCPVCEEIWDDMPDKEERLAHLILHCMLALGKDARQIANIKEALEPTQREQRPKSQT